MYNFVFNNFTPTLNKGLCLGPVFDMSLYIGSFLNFCNENSCNFVFASTWVITLSFILVSHKFNITFSTVGNPLSR